MSKKSELLNEIEKADTIAISGHMRPDGDCVGSCLGLYNYIANNYPAKTVFVYLEAFSKNFLFLNGSENVKHEADDKVYDLFIALDCGDFNRLGPFEIYLKRAKCTICVDHHVSNSGFADICYVMSECCSTAEALYLLLDEEKINFETAESLYLGIVHDTGVFKHSNTTCRAMEIAGKLIEKGARNTYIIDETFYKNTYLQNKLLGKALLGSTLYHAGKIIVSMLKKEDFYFEEGKATALDCDGIIDRLRVTENVECAIFIYAVEETYKVSMRSNGVVNVSEIAVSYQGGGHIRAAGFTAKGNVNEILDDIIQSVIMQIETKG